MNTFEFRTDSDGKTSVDFQTLTYHRCKQEDIDNRFENATEHEKKSLLSDMLCLDKPEQMVKFYGVNGGANSFYIKF